MNIAPSAKIYSNVKFGKNVVVEDFCIIGAPPRGFQDGELETVIGDGAIIRSHTVIYSGNRIGINFQTGNKVNIRELNDIGDDVSIGTLSVIEFKVSIANGVRIHSQAFVPEYSVLKEGCWLGPNAVLTNARYPKSPEVKNNLKGPIIGEQAIVGAGATILPGVNVGPGAIVGAGAVVVNDVLPGHVVAGNPAKPINERRNLPYSPL